MNKLGGTPFNCPRCGLPTSHNEPCQHCRTSASPSPVSAKEQLENEAPVAHKAGDETPQNAPTPSPNISEWHCSTCHGVWQCAKGDRCTFCAGTSISSFDLAKHGRSLIGQSNAWNYVWYKWKDHPLARAAARYNALRNTHGASSTINRMITQLLKASEAGSVPNAPTALTSASGVSSPKTSSSPAPASPKQTKKDL